MTDDEKRVEEKTEAGGWFDCPACKGKALLVLACDKCGTELSADDIASRLEALDRANEFLRGWHRAQDSNVPLCEITHLRLAEEKRAQEAEARAEALEKELAEEKKAAEHYRQLNDSMCERAANARVKHQRDEALTALEAEKKAREEAESELSHHVARSATKNNTLLSRAEAAEKALAEERERSKGEYIRGLEESMRVAHSWETGQGVARSLKKKIDRAKAESESARLRKENEELKAKAGELLAAMGATMPGWDPQSRIKARDLARIGNAVIALKALVLSRKENEELKRRLGDG